MLGFFLLQHLDGLLSSDKRMGLGTEGSLLAEKLVPA